MKVNTAIENLGAHRTMIRVFFIVSICVLLRILLDLAESKIYGFAFFITESILFSSFWWIFLPFLSWQLSFTNARNPVMKNISLVLIPIFTHLVVYPGIVWLLSRLFYYHTFSYPQTLAYELTEYSFILISIYSIPYTLFSYFRNKSTHDNQVSNKVPHPEQRIPLNSLVVVDGSEKRVIYTGEILYFSANSPYVNIHHQQKRYLYTETLKSLSQRLDDEMFIRVHKSLIVNIKHVVAYRSRLNGDYDLTLSEGTILRLSRNYASSFKQKFERTHRDTSI